MSEWIDEDLPASKTLSLESSGVRVGKSLVPWGSVLGALALPADAPKELYVLVPRRPPAPPWFAVGKDALPEELQQLGLSGLAQRIDLRARQGTYRDHAGLGAPLPPAELLSRVIARLEIPGALEVPVGHGPGAGFNRFLTAAASSAAAGATGLVAGLMVAPSLAGAFAGVSLALGAASPAGWHLLQGRMRGKPRVLVLAPDGCVIGFPGGVRAFGWSEIEGFGETHAALPGRLRPLYPHLEVTLRDADARGEAEQEATIRARRKGRLAAAWFDAPLPLIIRVAEAYRLRQTRSA
ncbi:MAG: hypothetical protein R3B40_08420 [Polyangiales bacterium]|nr:hypothetical protein [Myxococcales bacterium]MCB9656366.1 hypothetical protein [Sandaracinaceae bacterium]